MTVMVLFLVAVLIIVQWVVVDVVVITEVSQVC